jgi:nitronate monooxygenase
MGTAFLACEESGAPPLHREAILSGRAGRTALTRGFTGRMARGIDNELLRLMNRPNVEILSYPLQRSLMRNLALPAQKAKNAEPLPLWAGQSANLARCFRVEELLNSLVQGAAEAIEG